jgi:hypothetical protein
MTNSQLQALTKKKNRLISEAVSDMDEAVLRAQSRLYKNLSKQFLAKLLKDAKGVVSARQNRKLVANIERVFTQFEGDEGVALIRKFLQGVDAVMDANSAFYQEFQPDERMATLVKQARAEVRAGLGIGEAGKLVKNGYLDKLVKMPEQRMKVKRLALNKLDKGFFEMRDSMQKLVLGDKKNYGLMQGYYRNYAYDTISQADAVVGNKFAESLDLNFALYEGGLIATSRAFCVKRNGHVYHRSQILKWKPTEAVQPNYNPLIHLGGYGCRHHYNWITDELAVHLDSKMKKFVSKS